MPDNNINSSNRNYPQSPMRRFFVRDLRSAGVLLASRVFVIEEGMEVQPRYAWVNGEDGGRGRWSDEQFTYQGVPVWMVPVRGMELSGATTRRVDHQLLIASKEEPTVGKLESLAQSLLKGAGQNV